MNSQQNRTDVTATGASETPEPADGSGTSHKSLSLTKDRAQTTRKQETIGDLGTVLLTPRHSEKTQEPQSLAEKLRASGDASEMAEGNAQFFRHLEAVYSYSKKLEAEVAAASNTKKEIKGLVASLANATKGLIKWGRSTGRVKQLTSNRGSQTTGTAQLKDRSTQTDLEGQAKECVTTAIPVAKTATPEAAVPSPDRTKYEFSGAIKEITDMIKKQNVTISNLASRTEQVAQMVGRQEEQRPQQQKQQQPKQRQQQQQQKRKQKQQQKQLQHPQQKQQQPRQQQQSRQKQQPRQQQQPKQQQQQQQPKQPPSAPEMEQSRPTWSEVTRRRPKATDRVEKIQLLRRRAPKTAAVTIDRPLEGGSLAEVMKKVSRSIDLVGLGITVKTTRRTRAGGILLEVEGEEKAALLAERVRVLIGDGARVRQPESLTPVLLLDVPEWAAEEDVHEGLQKVGVNVGVEGAPPVQLWKNAGGRGGFVARVNLPIKEAIKLAEAKAITVGWTRCRVKPIETAKPRCFRCQERGHLAAECRNPAKPRRCHRCGGEDHLLRECRQPEKTDGDGAERERPARTPLPTAEEVEGSAGRTATTSQPDRAQ